MPGSLRTYRRTLYPLTLTSVSPGLSILVAASGRTEVHTDCIAASSPPPPPLST